MGADRLNTLRKLTELALTQLATFAFPLVFAVICGRTLGLHDYGIVSFYAALAGFLGMFIEFGLDWYGIRAVAQAQQEHTQGTQADPVALSTHLNRVLCNITLTKLLLCAAVALLSGGLLWHWRAHQEWPLMLASVAYLVGFACDPGWFVRALERTQLLLSITTGVRLLGIAVLLLAVPHWASMASALGVYALVSLLTSALTWFYLLRHGLAHWATPDRGYIVTLLRSSWAIVFGNLNGAILTNGGIALLGLNADPTTVGAANLALRVRMAGLAVLLPLNQLGFVRISAQAARTPYAAYRLGRRLLLALLALSTVITLVCLATAPWITHYVFKTEVPIAVVLILLLALSIPIQSAANLFGMQSLIAFGHERRYALIQTASTLVFCTSLFVVQDASAYGWAVLGAETTVMLLAGLALVRLYPEFA